MTKMLIKSGNSIALVIDKPILALVNIDPDAPVEISTDDGRRLIITPVRDAARVRKFRDAMAHANRKHEKTLRKLAE